MKIEDACKIKNYMSSSELKYLMDAVGRITDKTKAIVNVGVYYGASSATLLLGMQEHGITGPLFCIDIFRYHNAGAPKMKPFRERTDVPWSDTFLEQAKGNIAPFLDGKNIRYIECFSDDFSLTMVEGISLIFIDGDHSVHGCLLDALKYSQKVINGGFMLFHDYTTFTSVKRAVTIFTEIRPDFKLEGCYCSIAVVQKQGGEA